jgi:hypothetical protein
MFYVYVLKRPDGRVFYVGKGKGNRARKHSARSHNPIVNSIIKKITADGGSVTYTIVLETADEGIAFREEIALIKQYGRLNTETGRLVNLTDGGDGASGAKFSEEAKEKYRAAAIKRGESEEYRKARAESTRLDWAKNPQRSKTHSDYEKARWADPVFKQMVADKIRATTKVQWADPAAKQRIMDARKPIWQSAEFRANASLKQKKNWEDPEYRKRMGEQRKQQWADPLKRAAIIEAQRLGRLMKREVHP